MKHAIGSFVRIPFGSGKFQTGHITRQTRTGSVKIRAWNASKEKWMPNERTFNSEQVDTFLAVDPYTASHGMVAPPAID